MAMPTSAPAPTTVAASAPDAFAPVATLAESAVATAKAAAAPIGKDSTRDIPKPDLSAVDFDKFEIIVDKLVPEERSAIVERFESLGQVRDELSAHRNFTHVLLQVAHQEQQVCSVAPAFRIVRFATNERVRRLATKLIEKKTGGIKVGAHSRNGFTLICKCKEDQANPKANSVQDKIRAICNDFIEESWLRDVEFMASRYYRAVEGNTNVARRMQDAFTRNYNERGWVKYMRRRHKVHDDVMVVPGAHREAEQQSQQLRNKARKDKKKTEIRARSEAAQTREADADASAPAADGALTEEKLDAMADEELLRELDEEEARGNDDDAGDDDGAGHNDDGIKLTVERKGENAMKDLPQELMHNDQKFATISFLMERGPNMECLVMVHGVYRTMEEAENHLSALDRDLSPMHVHVVEIGKWIFPLDMLWENSHLSDRVEDLKESCADPRVKINQESRADAVKSTRKLRSDVKRRKEMDERMREQLCERMGVTDEQLMAILDDAYLGTDAVIAVCKIDDGTQRLKEAQRILGMVGVEDDDDNGSGAAAAAPVAPAPVSALA